MPGPVGIAANPASGKDIRRLVSRASVFDNQEKKAIIARCLVGMRAVADVAIRYVPDSHGITRVALEEAGLEAVAVEAPQTATALDTTRGAAALRGEGCGVVLTLGGDGTNRAFAKGWLDAPLLPISTGTNNVFPVLVEATVAGAAAGLVATGKVALEAVAERAKCVHVEIEGEAGDIALIDAVVTKDRFVGARALLDAGQLDRAVLTRADPAAVGMTSIGGLIRPVANADDGGLSLVFGGAPPRCGFVKAPIAPGLYQAVPIDTVATVAFGERVEVQGPCTLAFDGERERVLKPGQRATLTLRRDGPWVVDVERALQAAAANGSFRSQSGEADAN